MEEWGPVGTRSVGHASSGIQGQSPLWGSEGFASRSWWRWQYEIEEKL